MKFTLLTALLFVVSAFMAVAILVAGAVKDLAEALP